MEIQTYVSSLETGKLENHFQDSQQKNLEKDGRKGKPIPGFAREIILKVASLVEQEAKNDYSIYPLNAPTKRAAAYTGVSERTIQRIRNEDKKRKLVENGPEFINTIKKSVIGRDQPDDESSCTMKRKSKKGQTIPLSARHIISRVIKACDGEYKDGEYMAPFICTSKRTALYTGVSQRTVQRIKNEDERRNKINEETVLMTPGKKRKRSTFNDKIDDFDFYSIRTLIDELILVKKVSPSCTALHSAVKERIHFPYSENTLYRLLHSKGFGWQKGSKGKRILIEKPEIFKGRLDYLRKIKNYEQQGKFIIYFDEKGIGRKKIEDSFYKSEIFCTKGGLCCSGRLVILNEFSPVGFIKKAVKLFAPSTVDDEAKPDISIVENWLKNNFFPNIPPNSVVVMSTNHLRKEDDKIPNEYSSKQTLVKFLKEKHLKYTAGQTCLDLYGIIEKYLATLPNEWSEIDRLIQSDGHIVLRLPPYMSEFNPIELAWADIKRYVRDKNPTGKTSSKFVKEITLQAIQCLQMDTLQGYVNHVIQIENYFWDKQQLINEHYDSVTITGSTKKFGDNYDLPSKLELPNASDTNLNERNIGRNSSNFNSPESSITNSDANINLISNMYPSMLPHSQLCYEKAVATRVINKSTVICQNQGMDSGVMHVPGPSYLNL